MQHSVVGWRVNVGFIHLAVGAGNGESTDSFWLLSPEHWEASGSHLVGSAAFGHLQTSPCGTYSCKGFKDRSFWSFDRSCRMFSCLVA